MTFQIFILPWVISKHFSRRDLKPMAFLVIYWNGLLNYHIFISLNFVIYILFVYICVCEINTWNWNWNLLILAFDNIILTHNNAYFWVLLTFLILTFHNSKLPTFRNFIRGFFDELNKFEQHKTTQLLFKCDVWYGLSDRSHITSSRRGKGGEGGFW